jgi:xanthine/uracil permease
MVEKIKMLGNLIGGFVVILIGVNLLPTVANEVKGSQDNANVTGATDTIIGLVPLFFALGILSAGIALTAQGLRAAGMLGV